MDARVLRWGSLCGIIVPLLDIGLIVYAAVHRPEFDPLADFMSQLGIPDEPYSLAVSIGWMIFPFLFWPFAYAVYAGSADGPHAWVTPSLLVLFATFIGLIGAFRCDPGCEGRTLDGKLHTVASCLAGLCMMPCPYFLWKTTRGDERWRGYHYFHLVVQATGLVAFISLLLTGLHFTPWEGLFERVFWFLYYLWVAAVGVRLAVLGWR